MRFAVIFYTQLDDGGRIILLSRTFLKACTASRWTTKKKKLPVSEEKALRVTGPFSSGFYSFNATRLNLTGHDTVRPTDSTTDSLGHRPAQRGLCQTSLWGHHHHPPTPLNSVFVLDHPHQYTRQRVRLRRVRFRRRNKVKPHCPRTSVDWGAYTRDRTTPSTQTRVAKRRAGCCSEWGHPYDRAYE